MDCSNCGKDIPFLGKVCPYCNHDKSEDQFSTIATIIGGLPGAMAGGPIFFFLFHSVLAGLLGMVIGFFVGCFAIGRLRSLFRSASRSQPESSRYRKTYTPRRDKK